jgi:hypothetical protein
MSEISIALEAYTATHSNFETSRNYVSISHAYDSAEQMISTYFNGFEDSLEIRLRCYTGYKCERDMLQRIGKVFGDRVKMCPEIYEYEGLVKGHPDFMLDEYPADCKTVPLDEHLPDGRMPNRVFWQMQGYMLYLQKEKSIVIYESKATGKIQDYTIHRNHNIQAQIKAKFDAVVKEIKARQLQSA